MSEVKNTTQKVSTKKGSAKKSTAKKVTVRTHNKRINNLVEKSKGFNKKEAGSWDCLTQTSRQVELGRMGLSKAFKEYLKEAKTTLTANQMKHLTFKNLQGFASNSAEFKQLEFWTINNIKMLCQRILVANDANTARAKKVSKQGGVVGKKADKVTRRGANTK
jgi:hypothetical protein